MKHKFIVFVFLLLLGLGCKTQRLVVTDVEAPMLTLQISCKVQNMLFNTWIHSFEEDSANIIQVFRPKDYKFLPSRGRDSFTIIKSGKFIAQYPGPNDVPKADTGKWLYSKSEKMLDITFSHIIANPIPETQQLKKGYSLKVILLEKNVLKVIKTFN